MPKETVQTEDGQVAVGWQRDRDVQLGVALRPVVQYIDGGATTDATTTTTQSFKEGQWLTLDRAGLNRLIRALRKARDAAFGADA